MNRYASIGNAPGLDGPPDDPEGDWIEQRTAELMAEWMDDTAKLAEAADEVLGTAYSDFVGGDIARSMIGDARDQDARDLRFMRELRQKVRNQLEKEAIEQAERDWDSGADYDEELAA